MGAPSKTRFDCVRVSCVGETDWAIGAATDVAAKGSGAAVAPSGRMNFSTKRKGGSKKASWRDAQEEPAAKREKPADKEAGEDDSEGEEDAFAQLKRDLATRERIKAQRTKQLSKETALIARTRGEDERPPGVHVWLDISIPKRSTHSAGKGRLIFELFEDVVPKTCKNFCQLITGEKGDGLHLKNTVFFRIEDGKGICGGDIDKNDGTGGRSVYGRDFEDENHRLKHTNAGVLTTLSRRPNANQSQFEILLDERPEYDGRRVVFGRLVDGYAVLRDLEKLGTVTGVPKELAKIAACGLCEKGESSAKIIEAHQVELLLPKQGADMKELAKNYRNKTNHYDNSTRSALFSWTTSC